MKHTLVGFLTVIVIALMGYTFSNGGAYHGGQHAKVIENISTSKKQASIEQPKEKDDREKEMEKLNALRDKAGNISTFKVSQEYKSKCASCHGVDGSGLQNGKPMMGPKLFGKSAEEIFKHLVEFKSGRKENIVMKGLLLPMDEAQLRKYANEIGEFPARAAAFEKK